jgi:hypothetical protein
MEAVLLGKLTAHQLVNKFAEIYETRKLLPRYEGHAKCLYSGQLNPVKILTYFLKIHFHIIHIKVVSSGVPSKAHYAPLYPPYMPHAPPIGTLLLLLPWRYSPRWAKASFILGFHPEGFPSR